MNKLNKKLTIKEFPFESKPRERLFKYGVNSLSNAELLAIILNKGTKEKNVLDLANEILSIYNLKQLSIKSINELLKIKGIGFAKACQIVACFELSRRLASFKDDEKPLIKEPNDVFNLLHARFSIEKKEHFLCLFLDVKKRLIKKEIMFIGTLDSSLIHPREILKSAIMESASAIILVHNHPSGDSTPSLEDIEITKIIANACKLVSIPLLDHVIIGNNNFTSLRDLEELSTYFNG